MVFQLTGEGAGGNYTPLYSAPKKKTDQPSKSDFVSVSAQPVRFKCSPYFLSLQPFHRCLRLLLNVVSSPQCHPFLFLRPNTFCGRWWLSGFGVTVSGARANTVTGPNPWPSFSLIPLSARIWGLSPPSTAPRAQLRCQFVDKFGDIFYYLDGVSPFHLLFRALWFRAYF